VDKVLSKPTGKRGGAYIRVSDGDKQDPKAQRSTCERWAQNHGLTIGRWYTDVDGVNSRDTWEARDDFQRLIADVEAGKLDWVVVDSQERFGAGFFAFGHYAYRLIQNDCQLWSVADGLLTGEDDGTVFKTTVNNQTGTRELTKYGERQVSRKRELAAQGEWQGGYIPYGYDVAATDNRTGREVWRVVLLKLVPKQGIWHRVIVYPEGRQERCDGKDRFPKKQDWETLKLAPSIITERVTTAVEIFELYACGAWSVRGLCERLNLRHVDPVTGLMWYATRLEAMLENPLYYLGQTVWGKKSHGKNSWYVGGQYVIPPKRKGKAFPRANAKEDWVFPPAETALISKERWDEVQARLTGRPLIKRGLRDESLWLAGLLVCERCGRKLVIVGKSKDYCCGNYNKFGRVNPTGCRVHRAGHAELEQYVAAYLQELAPDVRALSATGGKPALLAELVAQMNRADGEFIDTLNDMRRFCEAAGVHHPDPDSAAIAESYRAIFDAERGQLEAQLTEAKAELRRYISNLNRIPEEEEEALAEQQALISEANQRVKDLKDKLTPLDEKLEAAYTAVVQLDAQLEEAEAAMAGDDSRRKALALRKIVNEIRLTFRHYDGKPRDKRTKKETVEGSVLETVEFVPVQGEPVRYRATPREPGAQTSAAPSGPGLTVHIGDLLRAVLTRRYTAAGRRRNSPTPKLIDQVKALAAEGLSNRAIARKLGTTHARVGRILRDG
jgi:DNA invertase Pin-like site-specific DNA recombinase